MVAYRRSPKNGLTCDECGGKIIRPVVGKLKKTGQMTRYSYGEPRCQNPECQIIYWGFQTATKEIPSELLFG